MHSSATALSSWILAVVRALHAAGVDGDALLARAGIARSALDDPDARLPLQNTRRLWELAADATGDPCFGLTVSRHVAPTTFHALGYALGAAPTLKDVFTTLVRYHRIVSDAADLRFEKTGESYRLSLHTGSTALRPHDVAIDAFAAIWVRTCRNRVGPDYAPLSVELQRPRPARCDCFDATFRAPIEFDAECTRVTFDAATFDRPLPDANPELARHNEQVLLRMLARLDRDDIRARVRTALVEQLARGEPSAEGIAEALHLSLRSLQRRLAEAGVTYESVLNDTRRELALSYVAETGYSLSEITFMLGFADTSSFSRAFRRWTGQSPSHYRRAR
jgi:AraC-like DNA-binding protein